MRRIVLDTNVLLADPGALLSYRDVEIIVPETVLSELDKLKTSRVDPELRFRGREVSRLLFDLSEQGNLIEGVDLPDGGRLRVAPVDSDDLPEGLSTRNADDRILAVALHASREDDTTVLVTNDLNMLLKAQTLGVRVERHEGGVEASFSRRFIIRPFQRYKIPIGILAGALAVFAAVVFVAIYSSRISTPGITAGVPTEFRELMTPTDQKILDYLVRIEQNPRDTETRQALADMYFGLMTHPPQTGLVNPARYAQLAIKHFEAVLEVRPDDQNIKTDLATCYFYAGDTDRAIKLTLNVLDKEQSHVEANFNLGVFYWRGRRDYRSAAAQFQTVINLTTAEAARGDESAKSVLAEAQNDLRQVRAEAAESGKPLESAVTTQ